MEPRTLRIKTLHFDASHYLDKSFGKCQNIHGHRFYVENLQVTCNKIVDLGLIKEAVDKFDHLMIIPKEHYEKWLKVAKFIEELELPCKLVFYTLDADLSLVEHISTALRKDLESIPGVLSANFILYEGDNQGVEV